MKAYDFCIHLNLRLLYSFKDNFKEIITKTKANQEFSFDFNCDFIHRSFGNNLERQINYQEFTQLLQVLFFFILNFIEPQQAFLIQTIRSMPQSD